MTIEPEGLRAFSVFLRRVLLGLALGRLGLA
jgi:hypothetical protein